MNWLNRKNDQSRTNAYNSLLLTELRNIARNLFLNTFFLNIGTKIVRKNLLEHLQYITISKHVFNRHSNKKRKQNKRQNHIEILTLTGQKQPLNKTSVTSQTQLKEEIFISSSKLATS